MTDQPNLPGVPAEESRRTKQVNLKLSEVEHAKLGQAAAGAELELAAWCRQTLLEAAGGIRAGTHVEVPIGDLMEVKERIERVGTIALATLHELFQHTHHGDPNKKVMDRLSVRSLLDDGAFIRLTHKKFAPAWLAKFEACLRAAAKAGEMHEIPLRHDLRAWLVHHIAFALMLHLHPEQPAVDYKVSKQALVEQTVWFALLGVGLKEQAIKRYYNPKALSLLTQ